MVVSGVCVVIARPTRADPATALAQVCGAGDCGPRQVHQAFLVDSVTMDRKR